MVRTELTIILTTKGKASACVMQSLNPLGFSLRKSNPNVTTKALLPERRISVSRAPGILSVVHLYLLYFRDYKLAFQLCCFRGIVTVYWATRLVLGLFRLYPSTSSGFVSVSGTKFIQFQMICLSSHVL